MVLTSQYQSGRVNSGLMALHPAPTIANHLALVTQRLLNSGSSRPAELTFAFGNDAGASPLTFINHFQTAFNTRFQPEFSTSVTIEKPFVTIGDGTNVPAQAIATGAAVAGTYANAMPPSQVAVLVKKGSGLGGRKNRGRTYFPWFIAESDVDNVGHITGGVVTTLQALMTGFIGDMGATYGTPMVISNKTLAIDIVTGKPYVTAITRGPLVTSYTVEDIVATQRRRLSRT